MNRPNSNEKGTYSIYSIACFPGIHNIIILWTIGGISVRLEKKGFYVGLYFGKENENLNIGQKNNHGISKLSKSLMGELTSYRDILVLDSVMR